VKERRCQLPSTQPTPTLTFFFFSLPPLFFIATQVRASLKEPLRAKAKAREAIYYRTAQWAEGAPRQAEVVDLVDPEVEAAAKSK